MTYRASDLSAISHAIGLGSLVTLLTFKMPTLPEMSPATRAKMMIEAIAFYTFMPAAMLIIGAATYGFMP